jgi:hypothetical protein
VLYLSAGVALAAGLVAAFAKAAISTSPLMPGDPENGQPQGRVRRNDQISQNR